MKELFIRKMNTLQYTVFRCLGKDELNALSSTELNVLNTILGDREIKALLGKNNNIRIEIATAKKYRFVVAFDDMLRKYRNRIEDAEYLRLATANRDYDAVNFLLFKRNFSVYECILEAMINNDRRFLNLFIKRMAPINYDWNREMEAAAYRGRRDLVNFFVFKGANHWNDGMCSAAEGGHRDLVDFFVDKGANEWNFGMRSAAAGGHRDLVNFFISKGANHWNYGMINAASGGHRDLVDFFIDKGADFWDGGMATAVAGGHRDLVDFFVDRGANDWDHGIINAIQYGHPGLVEFFIDKVSDCDWNYGMAAAIAYGDFEFIEFLISKGANDWNWGMAKAVDSGDRDLVDFFISKGANDWRRGLSRCNTTYYDRKYFTELFNSLIQSTKSAW